MAAVDPELAVVVARPGVGAGRGRVDGGLLVVANRLVAHYAGPGPFAAGPANFEPPAVV